MYSVIQCGGFQHRVTVGETLKVSKLDAQVGDVVTVQDVLLFSNGDKVQVGAPLVSGASVRMEVLSHDRDDKITIFKKKRRKRYKLTKGHRQHYTEVIVSEMALGADKAAVDAKLVERARARVQALLKQKVQGVPLTKAQKIAAVKAAQAAG